jgi:hypothetical protein
LLTTSSARRLSSGQVPTYHGASPTRTLVHSPLVEDNGRTHTTKTEEVADSPEALQSSNIEYSDHATLEQGQSDELYNDDEEDEEEEETTYEPIPNFQPFFTLIEDSVTNEHHHPTVHYIFADDDPDIIVEAACRSLETLDPSQQRAHEHEPHGQAQVDTLGHDDDDDDGGGDGDEHIPPRLPPPTPGVKEHYLLLDIQPRPRPSHSTAPVGTTTNTDVPHHQPSFQVTAAHSFSADWQIQRTSITAAPTIGEGHGEDEDEDGDRGLMLKIEGRGNTTGALNEEQQQPQGKEKESMEDMIQRFQRRMDDIRQVLAAS